MSKAIRIYREHHRNGWLHLVKNLEPEDFQKCLKKTVCAIGNSSSFIRDSTFSGTPVVLVGNRQVGRETGFESHGGRARKGGNTPRHSQAAGTRPLPAFRPVRNGGAAAKICDVLSKPIPSAAETARLHLPRGDGRMNERGPFFLGVIPARGGSKGIKDKNIRTLAGKPLIAYTIEAANASVELDDCLVSTDSDRIAGVARECGGSVPFLRRPAELARDQSPTIDALVHAVGWYERDHSMRIHAVVVLQPTAPLRIATGYRRLDQALQGRPGTFAIQLL